MGLALLASLTGLALIYLASVHVQPTLVRISEVGDDAVGGWVVVEGNITHRSDHPEGHIFLRLGDGTGEMMVPVFRGLAERLEGRECLQKGHRLRVRGRVEEYRGSLEVVPKEPDDILCLEERH